MISGLYLNDKLKSFEETWEKAHEAMNIFLELEDWEGIAETNFLFAMIIRKKDKVKQHKSDSLILRKHPKSDYFTEEDLEFETELHKTLSQVSSIEEDEMSLLEKASQQFCYLKHKYGMARVSLAIATRYIELASISGKLIQVKLKVNYEIIVLIKLKLFFFQNVLDLIKASNVEN